MNNMSLIMADPRSVFHRFCRQWAVSGKAPIEAAEWLRDRGLYSQAEAWEWAGGPNGPIVDGYGRPPDESFGDKVAVYLDQWAVGGKELARSNEVVTLVNAPKPKRRKHNNHPR